LPGRDDHDVAPEARRPRVLRMHGRDGGDPLLSRDAADVSAGQAIAPGAERGTGDDRVRGEPAQRSADLGERLVLPLAHEVVAAAEGRDDVAGLAPRLL